jgi:hypothetical protein
MVKPARRRRPELVLTANLWTLAGHPTLTREWSLDRKVRAVAAAGFQAITAPASPELAALCRQHGLRYMGFFSSSDPREFRWQVAAQRKAGAELVNVQLGDDFTPVHEGTRLAKALLREAAKQGIYAAIEVHRDTATETPEKTYAIADAYQRATGNKLPVTWDHSHFAVVKHLKPFLYREALLQRPELIQAARIFHLRPFNGQHAQVPVMDRRGRLTPEFKSWLEFAEALLRLWLVGPQPGGELWVVPEIGPVGIHGYNLSIMEPSWAQALRCQKEIRRLWRRLILS